VLTRICGHDAEWQSSPEHAASRQSRQDEATTRVLERIMQVRSLSYCEAIARIPVQKHLHANDSAGNRGLQMQMCQVVGSVRVIQHTAVTAYRRQASVCDGRDITAESTMPRDDCWKGLVTTLGGRFRSSSRIRGRAPTLPKERRGRFLSPDRGVTGPNNGLVYAKRLRRSMREEWWWSSLRVCSSECWWHCCRPMTQRSGIDKIR
jgi:hypothetical protein